MTAADPVAAIAALGLAGAPVPPHTLTDDAARELLARCRSQKLVGLLDQALGSDVIAASDDVADEIGAAAVVAASRCLQVERHLLAVHELFDRHDLEHRFLKGATVARRFEAHPALRTFVDVDVLVRGRDVDRAVAVLEATGHERSQPEFRPGFAGRWGKSVTMRVPGGIEVDLHRTLASGPFGVTGDVDALWAQPADLVAIGGVAVPALDPTGAFVHACVHATTGVRAHLATLRDVLRILPRTEREPLDALERALGVEACVTEAVRLAVTTLRVDPTPDAAALAGRPIPARQRRWLDLYSRPDQSFRRLSRAAVGAVPGVGGKLRYAWALARPR